MNEKPTIFYRECAAEYPNNPATMGYQKAEITVFYSCGIPSSCSNGLFRLSYQRNYEESTKTVSNWYGEDMDHVSDPRADKIQDIAKIFMRMEKYLDNIRKKGLSLDVSRSDDYHWRIALLKKIGAFPIEWNKEKHEYSSYQYSVRQKAES
jgi:hypothetical protein